MVALLAGMVLASGTAADPPVRDRVGSIIIEGNVRTGDAAILNLLDGFYPGAELPSEADRLRCELRLLVAFHRRFDLDAGLRPEVVVLPNDHDSVFRDLLIRFPEKARRPRPGR